MRDLGNVLRHEYDGVDLPQVWSIVEHDLDKLAACEQALTELTWPLGPIPLALRFRHR